MQSPEVGICFDIFDNRSETGMNCSGMYKRENGKRWDKEVQ